MNQSIVKIFPADAAKKLGDLFLPVTLRDFWLGMAPIIQCYIYQRSSGPEEFFTLVLMEHARFHNDTMNSAWLRDDSFEKFGGLIEERIIEIQEVPKSLRIK